LLTAVYGILPADLDEMYRDEIDEYVRKLEQIQQLKQANLIVG